MSLIPTCPEQSDGRNLTVMNRPSFPGRLLLLAIWSLVYRSALCQPHSAVGDAGTNAGSGFRQCTTPAAREDSKGHERFLLLNERAKEAGTTAQLVFLGDSITQGWENAGRDTWNKYYVPRHALNLGIGSDHTQHVLWRVDHGNLDGLKPKLVVLLIGVNNVPDETNSGADVLAGIKAVVERIRNKLPETKILLLGIFPFRENFNLQRGKALQVNQALCHVADGRSVFFLDFGHKFIQPDGRISREIMRDFLHPTAAGYRIWAEEMETKVAELLGEKPKQDL
jgi:lysophospholipase L1-like esterase